MRLFFILAFYSIVLPLSYAAMPRYYCAAEEIKLLMSNKNQDGSVMYPGDIKSISITPNGYLLVTDKCDEVEVGINYIPTNDMRPCTLYKVVIKPKECRN